MLDEYFGGALPHLPIQMSRAAPVVTTCLYFCVLKFSQLLSLVTSSKQCVSGFTWRIVTFFMLAIYKLAYVVDSRS